MLPIFIFMFYARQGGGGTLTVFMCYGMDTGSGGMGYTLNNIHVGLRCYTGFHPSLEHDYL